MLQIISVNTQVGINRGKTSCKIHFWITYPILSFCKPCLCAHACVRAHFIFFLSSSSSLQGSNSISSASSSLTLTISISSFTPSINVLSALPPGLLPASSHLSTLYISHYIYPINSLSLLCTCPNHLSPASLSPKHPRCAMASDGLIADPVRPGRCLRGTRHFNLSDLQLCCPILPPLSCKDEKNLCSLFPRS